MGKVLAGKSQGGYGSGKSQPAKQNTGANGQGTMPFATKVTRGNAKDIMADTQRAPMPDGHRGRVLYSSANKRIGRQEGTGPAS